MARRQGAETIDFEHEDPVRTILDLTRNIGVDRAIDAVGVDAMHAHHGPAGKQAKEKERKFRQEVATVAPNARPADGQWQPGDAPSQALAWAVAALAKAGTLGIIGVYPPAAEHFPIGEAMNKNLTIKMGNCDHRKYIPHLIEPTRAGAIDPAVLLTQVDPIGDAIEAFKTFDRHESGCLKVKLDPQA